MRSLKHFTREQAIIKCCATCPGIKLSCPGSQSLKKNLKGSDADWLACWMVHFRGDARSAAVGKFGRRGCPNETGGGNMFPKRVRR
jgi:hypothetical protein